jgi:catechol 2,3-dioxygenase-like lactoylglutathione lyase family enzyme
MLKVSHLCLFVQDQDEALAFYRDKVGFEPREDVTMDGFRWVTLTPPDQPDLEISLIDPDATPLSPENVAKVRELLAAGALAGPIMQTDDCRAMFETLSSRGVEFTEEPNERFYGIDAAFRDPSGNGWRLVQPVERPAVHH